MKARNENVEVRECMYLTTHSPIEWIYKCQTYLGITSENKINDNFTEKPKDNKPFYSNIYTHRVYDKFVCKLNLLKLYYFSSKFKEEKKSYQKKKSNKRNKGKTKLN